MSGIPIKFSLSPDFPVANFSSDSFDGYNEIADAISSATPNGKFHIWAKNYIVTYKGWLNKDAGIKFFTDLGAKTVRVAHEIGTKTIGYEHSHVFAAFGKQFNSQSAKIFDIQGVHPNIGPISYAKHLNRVYKYMCKYDHTNDDMLKWVDIDVAVQDVWDCHTMQDAVKHARKITDVPAIIAAWGCKPADELKPKQCKFLWQRHLAERLYYSPSNGRDIIWFYDSMGKVGKSRFLDYMKSTHPNDVLNVTQFNGASNAATVIASGLANGWTGKICLVDLPRDAESKSIYEPLEMICNGEITIVKYVGRPLKWNAGHVVVFANFLQIQRVCRLTVGEFLIYVVPKMLN